MSESIEQLLDNADLMVATQNYEKAFTIYNRVLERNTACDEAYLFRGELHAKLGQLDKAFEDVLKAISIDPNYDVAYLVLALLYQSQGEMEKAIEAFRKTLSLNLKNQEAVNHLVKIYVDFADKQITEHQPELALENYQKALELVSDDPYLMYKYAFAMARTGDFDQAKKVSLNILAENKNHVLVQTLLVNIYEKTGEVDKGWEVLRQLADQHPQNPSIVISYGKYALRKGEYAAAIKKLKPILKQFGLRQDDQLSVHMLLGKLYDAASEYETAFFHFKHANGLKYNDYNVDEFKAQVESLIQALPEERYRALPVSSNESQSCIFILGMPRSGTSLIEQIISSHSRVYGGGELQNMPALVHEIETSQPGFQYSQCLNNLNQEQLNDYAEKLLASMHSLSPESEIITDKLPHNFLFIGFIHKLLPNAKFINCLRDPVDNCLSCYFQHFGGYHPYAYNLEHLGKYYLEYKKLMTHWENVLNIPILNVQYENLVNNTEEEVASILSYLELDWQDDCLAFYKQKRTINTASYTQVSQKIYTDSVQRWKNYQPYISDLTRVLL